MARPLDRSPYYVDHFEHLDRILNRAQLAGIGISGNVGAGLFISSGILITTTGSLGAAVSYAVAGTISASVLYSLTEMVAARPLTGSLIDLCHNFLDPASGFTVAASYALANICSMATLTASSAELTALLKNDPTPHSAGKEVGINLGFIALTTLSHCLGVKLYGKIERVIMWFKLCLFVLVMVLMATINAGGGGPREGPYQSNYTSHAFTPGWKPTGFESTEDTFLRSSGVPDTHFGLPGSGGRLFAFFTAVTLAIFSCFGGEMVAMTAGEAKHPWKDVPLAMSFTYIIPLSLYPFAMISAGANVNYADPNLPKIWARGNGSISLSPFVVAAQTASLGSLPKVLNLFFIISAYTAANTALYVSSRSVFMLSQQYMPKKIADIFGRTNNGHTPLAAILLCSGFGLLSLIGLSKYAYSQPRLTLSEFYTGTIACVYVTICLTFLKFKAGLDRLANRKIISRNDELYISRLFKSRWQPLPAYVGIIGCSFVVLWSGIPPIYILASRPSLTSSMHLKSPSAIAFDVVGAYIGPIIFVTLFFSYKYVHPRSRSVDIRDLTPSDYIIEDLASMERENPLYANGKAAESNASPTRPSAIELAAHRNDSGQIQPEQGEASTQGAEDYDEIELSPDEQDQWEAEIARREERRRVVAILETRPKRMERGFWRELWSFVIVDKEKTSPEEETG